MPSRVTRNSGGGQRPDDDSTVVDDDLFSEEVVSLTAFQDNRFSSAEPIYVNAGDPDIEETGNLWVYADVPLQEAGGVDVDPLLGFAQGTCQGVFSNLDGYCFFTYEFFDGMEVIATLTVQGATQPMGPSILTVVGGTGELEGVSGDVSLIPATLDTTVTPPAVVRDESTFLGNPDGYYMEALLYVRYRIADIPGVGGDVEDPIIDDVVMMDDVVAVDPTEGPVPSESPVLMEDVTMEEEDVDVEEEDVEVLTADDLVPADDFVFTTVLCEGKSTACDCSANTCSLALCMCEEAQEVNCCDGSGFVGK